MIGEMTSAGPQPRIDVAVGRVVVGLSGGVDSSVTAAVLKRAGFDVIGMTMQIWHRSSADGAPTANAGCCTIDAVDDARRVARQLDIPYYVPNFREPFSVVIDDFAEQYARGRTPNPCVRCNQLVRFDGLLRKADEVEAEYVATGHYARVHFDDTRNEMVLKRAVDTAKDQSYVLHRLTQEQLRRLILPLGELRKSETRSLASQFGLNVATKPDSQEICFVGTGNYRDFLAEVSGVSARSGDIVDTEGNILGAHEGVHNFTVGQRKGLGAISSTPTYVVELDGDTNTVVIGAKDEVMRSRMVCEDLHFVGAQEEMTFRAGVRIRSHAAEKPAEVHLDGATAVVDFDEPVWGATPGQAAVFYDDDRVVGGGTIAVTSR